MPPPPTPGSASGVGRVKMRAGEVRRGGGSLEGLGVFWKAGKRE